MFFKDLTERKITDETLPERGPSGREAGFALVLALVVLFLMSLLGTILFTTSTTEVQISRNFSTRQGAFFAAERGLEYAVSDGGIYSAIGTGSVSIPLTGVSLQIDNTDANGTVEYLSGGNPPRGSGVDITQFQANYFVTNVTGTGQGNSQVELEANVARIVPKEY